ncbi:MAG: ABC transporter ATP-binding protein [Propionibacteriaceae bacterium]|nr:ABC transporter ATP-binding protein [Propionibacteriaceae bacterium]
MVEPVVYASGLVKRFGDLVAVDGVDFEVRPGEAFGLLGPNGAGKSTTMRLVGAVSQRTAGELKVFGLDPDTHGPEVRAQLGVVPQDDNLDLDLRVRENLVVYGRYFGLPRDECRKRADDLLAFAELSDRAGVHPDVLSGGMRRRLTIARGLMNAPRLLMLDEPTTGLDPQARHLLWDRLYRLKERGTTLVITTHFMDEAEQLCDRLIVIDHGHVVAAGTPAGLIADHVSKEVAEFRFGAERNAAAAAALGAAGLRAEELPDRVLVYTDDGDAVLGVAVGLGLHPISSLVRRASLEDVFLRLTGRRLIE